VDQHPVNATKKCPMCAEEVLLDARKCKHCGEDFTRASRMGAIRRRALLIGVPILLIGILVGVGLKYGYQIRHWWWNRGAFAAVDASRDACLEAASAHPKAMNGAELCTKAWEQLTKETEHGRFLQFANPENKPAEQAIGSVCKRVGNWAYRESRDYGYFGPGPLLSEDLAALARDCSRRLERR